MRDVFRIPAFVRLLLAYTLNELAWSVGTLSLAILVYNRTGSAIGASGFFLLSQVVPGVISPALVARLERFSPRRLLPTLYWAEAVLFGVLAWLTYEFRLAPVLVLVLLDGVVALTARSIAGAVRADILKPVGLLHEGNALTNTAFSICFMVGPLIGGVVVVAGGTVAALIGTAGLFAVMGTALISDALPGDARHSGPSKGRLREAVRYVRSDPALRALMSLWGIGIVFFTISTPIEVFYAEHTLHVGAGGYGAIIAAWGGGAIVGSLIYARWSRSSMRILIGGSSFVIALGFAVLTVAPTLAVALIGAVLAGVANGICGTAFRTETLNLSPPQWMALISALGQSIAQVAPGIGILIGGVIASAGSTRVAFGVAGAGSLVFAIVTVIVLSPGRMAGEADHAGSDRDPERPPEPDERSRTESRPAPAQTPVVRTVAT